MSATEGFLRNTRKTGTVLNVPPKGPASSSPVWRRAATPFALSRRLLLRQIATASLPFLARAQDPSADHGRVKPPLPAPEIVLITQDGSSTSLSALAQHHATAVQLIFTRCTTTCRLQGAIFEKVQELLPDQLARGIQLISLSIDPRNDAPATLRAWLRRFRARPGWIAAAPQPDQVEQMKTFFGRGRSAADDHSTQVSLLNPDGLLVWRTFELPAAEDISNLLIRM
jgi:protein SCO1/2